MKRSLWWLTSLVSVVTVLSAWGQIEEHRATRLGNPATRFAPPLATPEDLRARFQDESLKPDFATVLRQWGWMGDLEDLHRAARTAEITEIKIPVGSRMPFMSSRENGRPVCLRNVLWAGKEPAPAYAFPFTSRGRRYRCVTPKACSNFYVEDLGPEPLPALELSCKAPGEILFGRPVEIHLSVVNSGQSTEPKASVSLSIPPGARVIRVSEAGVSSETQINWEINDVRPKATLQLGAIFSVGEPGLLSFEGRTRSTMAKICQTSCTTKVIGIPAILIDAVDLEDPVEVGQQVTYDIKVTNQGSAPGTNVRLTCRLPQGEEFVSGGGASAVQARDSIVVTEALPTLAPKAEAVWRVVVKATQPGDVRFKIELTSDQFERPIHEEESTHLY